MIVFEAICEAITGLIICLALKGQLKLFSMTAILILPKASHIRTTIDILTCQPTREMSIYTHFRHFLLLHTHIFHIFSTLNLNNLLDNLVSKYAHGLAKPKNDDNK